MEPCSVHFCAPLSYCEKTAVPSNQSLFRLKQHRNSHRGVEIQRRRWREITFLFLFEINMVDHLSTLLSVAVSQIFFHACANVPGQITPAIQITPITRAHTCALLHLCKEYLREEEEKHWIWLMRGDILNINL